MATIKYTKDNSKNNFESFKDGITSMRIKEAEKTVIKSDASAEEFKFLTVQLFKEVEHIKSNTQKNRIVDIVEAWSIDLNDSEWREELKVFCKKKQNIVSAFEVSNSGKEEFVILMDDVTDDSVLEYNEFAFELRAKYSNIHDFMILDADMEESINSMFYNKEIIYERGQTGAKDI